MPSIRVTSSMFENAGVGVIDSELEGYNRVAAISISFDECGGRCGRGISSAMPGETIAGCLIFDT